MGLLDNLESMAMGQMTGSNNAGSGNAASEILQMIQNHPGGISGLVQSFHNNGLGGLVNSWISTGQNQPINATQIEQVLGSSQVQALAQKLGIDPNQASSLLSQMLPNVIDKLSPNGAVPNQSNLMQMGESLLASFQKTGTQNSIEWWPPSAGAFQPAG
jgi:uncharacterized protein YidB (DUF937 family)